MRTQSFLVATCLMLGGSVFAHAAGLVNPFLAVTDVPEPSSVMLGAGVLLIGLGMVRRRKK